jgi:hypothetical protein
VSEADELITSTRKAAAVCGVTRFAARAWIDAGLLPEPPWTAQQLRQASDAAMSAAVGKRCGWITVGLLGQCTITTAGCFARLDQFHGDRFGAGDLAGGQLGNFGHGISLLYRGVSSSVGASNTGRALGLEEQHQRINV